MPEKSDELNMIFCQGIEKELPTSDCCSQPEGKGGCVRELFTICFLEKAKLQGTYAYMPNGPKKQSTMHIHIVKRCLDVDILPIILEWSMDTQLNDHFHATQGHFFAADRFYTLVGSEAFSFAKIYV
uniref:Uncharacterized protein n=1 Tax=Romanomermis culicivorax TaxID=13658 RepID=A0A915KWH8_ROMCU